MSEDIEYQCIKCGYVVKYGEVRARWEKLGISCTNCGYKVLRKVRPKVVKRVKAI